MSIHVRTSHSKLIKRLVKRSAQSIIVGLSVVSSPAVADGWPGPGPSSLQVDQTTSASATCLADSQAIVVFDRLDRDSDGRLTRTDIRRREAGRDRVRVVAPDRHTQRFDLDGDGMATRQEAVAASSCALLRYQGQTQALDNASRNSRDGERPAD